MTSETNRGSVQSGFSEFSFEHTKDDSLLNAGSMPEALRSPPKTTYSLESLTRENVDLKAKVLEQAEEINSLKNEIYDLHQELKKHNKIPKTPSSAIQPVELILPPRSANRKKSQMHLKTPEENSVDEADDIGSSANTTIVKADDTLELQHCKSKDAEPQSLSKNDTEVTQEVKAQIDTTPKTISRHSSSYSIAPVTTSSERSTSNVTTSITRQPQVSPYSGRIQHMTSPINSSFSNQPAKPSDASSTKTSLTSSYQNGTSGTKNSLLVENQDAESSTDAFLDQNRDLESKEGQLQSSDNLLRTVNILKGPPIINIEHQNPPDSPLETKGLEPLSRANLFDPYGGKQVCEAEQTSSNEKVSIISTDLINGRPRRDSQIQSLEIEPKKFPTDVPLFVEPTELSTVKVEILSTICGNYTKKSDDPVVTIEIRDRQTSKELWRIKKSLSKILLLDTQIRPLINSFSLPPVPEKALFLSNIPIKVDVRRQRLRDYFTTLFAIPHLPLEAAYKISRFLSLDVVNLIDESNTEVQKDGYLLRKAKGLGNNWKVRYCQIDGAFMNVFDNFNGSLLEIIKLTGAQIGRQPDHVKPSDDKNSFRHAFAVMEPKKNSKSNSFIKHVFCAETDNDRDQWVNALLQFTNSHYTQNYTDIRPGDLSSMSSSQTILQELNSPIGPSTQSPTRTINSTTTKNSDDSEELEEMMKETKRMKKRSFFPFSKKIVTDEFENFRNQLQQQQQQFRSEQLVQHNDAVLFDHDEQSINGNTPSNIEKSLQELRLDEPREATSIFHNELSEVVKLSNNVLYGYEVPSVMYRCLDYLDTQGAIFQEGLFRLNGSAALIKQLREAFDKNFDIDFNKMEPKPDINTIAGLLKLYLRELPSSILTKESYPVFQAATTTIQDPAQIALEFGIILKSLPVVNQSLLHVLFKFLNKVVVNQESNKMNLRNLCIVFSPTLNVNSEIIAPFLVDFKCIFEGEAPIKAEDREILDLHIPTF